MNLPKMKCSELINALLQITIDTDDTTDKLKAPTVPSWNFSPSPIFSFVILNQNKNKGTNINKQNPHSKNQDMKRKSENKTKYKAELRDAGLAKTQKTK